MTENLEKEAGSVLCCTLHGHYKLELYDSFNHRSEETTRETPLALCRPLGVMVVH